MDGLKTVGLICGGVLFLMALALLQDLIVSNPDRKKSFLGVMIGIAAFAILFSLLVTIYSPLNGKGTREMTELFELVLGAIALATVLYPIYLAVFIYKRITAEKRQQPKPKWGFMVAYTVMVLLVLLGTLLPPWSLLGNGPSKQSEARTNLGAIFTTQLAYFANNNTYTNDFTLLNWAPSGGSLYTYTCGAGIIENTKGEAYPASAVNIGVAQVSSTGFTCMAVGNIDNDTTLDYWTINDAKSITNTPTSDLEY